VLRITWVATGTREFKFEAVKLVLERGMAAAQVAKDLGIHANVVSRWVREARADRAQLGARPRRRRLPSDKSGCRQGVHESLGTPLIQFVNSAAYWRAATDPLRQQPLFAPSRCQTRV